MVAVSPPSPRIRAARRIVLFPSGHLCVLLLLRVLSLFRHVHHLVPAIIVEDSLLLLLAMLVRKCHLI